MTLRSGVRANIGEIMSLYSIGTDPSVFKKWQQRMEHALYITHGMHSSVPGGNPFEFPYNSHGAFRRLGRRQRGPSSRVRTSSYACITRARSSNESIASMIRKNPCNTLAQLSTMTTTFQRLASLPTLHTHAYARSYTLGCIKHTDVPTQTTHHDTAYTSRRSADLPKSQSARHPVGGTQRELIQSRLPAHRESRLAARDTMGSPPAPPGGVRALRGKCGDAARRNRVRTDDTQICSSYAAVGASCEQRLGGKVWSFESCRVPAGKEVVRRRKRTHVKNAIGHRILVCAVALSNSTHTAAPNTSGRHP